MTNFIDLVDDFADAFDAYGPPIPYAEHRMDTGDHVPIAVPPYQLNGTKKQLLKVAPSDRGMHVTAVISAISFEFFEIS